MERWKPNTTVATVVTRNNNNEQEYLLVHEICNGKPVYNQPAGHLDEGESLIDAAVRETREETAWEVSIESLIGIYRFPAPNGITYMRYAFHATPIEENVTQSLDKNIIESVWLNYKDICRLGNLRSALVVKTIDDYLQQESYPLKLLHDPQ